MVTGTEIFKPPMASVHTGQDQLRDALVRTAFFPLVRQQGPLT